MPHAVAVERDRSRFHVVNTDRPRKPAADGADLQRAWDWVLDVATTWADRLAAVDELPDPFSRGYCRARLEERLRAAVGLPEIDAGEEAGLGHLRRAQVHRDRKAARQRAEDDFAFNHGFACRDLGRLARFVDEGRRALVKHVEPDVEACGECADTGLVAGEDGAVADCLICDLAERRRRRREDEGGPFDRDVDKTTSRDERRAAVREAIQEDGSLPKVAALELADRFNCTTTTIYRDKLAASQ